MEKEVNTMNVTLPEKDKLSKKTITIYIVSAIICVFSIIIVIAIQILGDDIVNGMFGVSKLIKRTEDEEQQLKLQFETIFDNGIEDKGNYRTQKIDENKLIVFTNYKKQEKTDNYEININLPFINIKNKTIQNFNEEISNTFETKAEDILQNDSQNVVYTVKYKASIENNILSLIIYSDLKQEMNAQRIIVQTFCYNIEEKKELDLKDVLKIYSLNDTDVQNKIKDDINKEQKKSNDLKELGYNVFLRDVDSDIYNIENVEEFFVYNNNIYIIFAYGNSGLTSEKDIVII